MLFIKFYQNCVFNQSHEYEPVEDMEEAENLIQELREVDDYFIWDISTEVVKINF